MSRQGLGRAAAILVVLAAWWLPLAPRAIVSTKADDLAHHVRHVSEYAAALREGQWPPLVAPNLNGGIRVPIFQYYSGTAYLVPGLLCAAGLDPYDALKAAVLVHLAAAGLAVGAIARELQASYAAGLLSSVAFLLYPFASTDLLRRGAWPEFAALQVLPILFYTLLRLVRRSGERPRLRLAVAALAWAYFIPLHPPQTALGGAMVAALITLHSLLDLRQPRALGPAAAALAMGVLASAWFWWPIARDMGSLRVAAHQAFLQGTLTPSLLLSPVYRSDGQWSPQAGVHFVLAALVVGVWGARQVWLGRGCAALSILLVALATWGHHSELVRLALQPLQWSYRLLVPAALPGALCLAFALDRARAVSPGLGRASLAALAAYLALAMPGYLRRDLAYSTRVEEVMAPGYEAPNSSYYAFRGTDLRWLGWEQAGSLRTGVDLPVPRDGGALQARIELVGPADASVAVVVDELERARTSANPAAASLEFSIRPRIGLGSGDRKLRFESRPEGARWRVADLAFHADADPPGLEFRLPKSSRPLRVGLRSAWEVLVDRAGAYQVPACVFPGARLFVNGVPRQPLSTNRFLAVLELDPGLNRVESEQRPGPILAFSALVVLALGLALVLPR